MGLSAKSIPQSLAPNGELRLPPTPKPSGFLESSATSQHQQKVRDKARTMVRSSLVCLQKLVSDPSPYSEDGPSGHHLDKCFFVSGSFWEFIAQGCAWRVLTPGGSGFGNRESNIALVGEDFKIVHKPTSEVRAPALSMASEPVMFLRPHCPQRCHLYMWRSSLSFSPLLTSFLKSDA